jgi:hypothetical protein
MTDNSKPKEPVKQEPEHKETKTRPEWQEAMLRRFLAGH